MCVDNLSLLLLQAAEECVDEEQSGLKSRAAPKWTLPFTPSFTPADKMSSADKVGLQRCAVMQLGLCHCCWGWSCCVTGSSRSAASWLPLEAASVLAISSTCSGC